MGSTLFSRCSHRRPLTWPAALKVCLRLTATNFEVDHISLLPIDLVALTTSRRKSISEIIDEVEAAIAEDAAATLRREHAGLGGHVTLRQHPLKQRSRVNYTGEVTILMAGMAAETVFHGEHADGAGAVRGSDLQRTTGLATVMGAAMGFGPRLVYHDAQDAYSLDRVRRSDLKLKGRVDAILKSCLKNATDLISADWQAVMAIAKHLTKHGAMSGHQVRTVMERQQTSVKRRAATQTTSVA